MTGPLQRYRSLVDEGALDRDAAQEEAAALLDGLHRRLNGYRGPRRRFFGGAAPAPKGLYLWGGVGRGKSLLMDIFFNNVATTSKRRAHFHEFMIDAHDRISAWRQASDSGRRNHPAYDRKAPYDPIVYAAHDLSEESRVICFDEFQVTDIADAMVLGRLFEGMFARGVVMVSTSNRHPDDLYKDGLNRGLFLPFIDLLKSRNDVFHLDATRDYRLQRLSGDRTYYCPLGPQASRAMDEAWRRTIAGATEQAGAVAVKGRTIRAPRTARGAARFSFDALCGAPLGPQDYLALVRRFDTLFVDDIPRLGPEMRNEAKRFVTLIDAVYESRTKFICSADAAPDDLYPSGDGAFEFARTASRLHEMQTDAYLEAERRIGGAPDA